MQTRIIAAFPGSGKSYYHKMHPETTLDSDSSGFSWLYSGGEKVLGKDGKPVRNPNFPENYIRHIKENIGKYEYIFVSTHKEVRDALKKECIFFYLAFPGFGPIETYIKRYKERGSSSEFIELLQTNWMNWNQELYNETEGCAKWILSNNTITEFLEINQ